LQVKTTITIDGDADGKIEALANRAHRSYSRQLEVMLRRAKKACEDMAQERGDDHGTERS
jgi:hypothetical protein